VNRQPPPGEKQVLEAVDWLLALRDELYLAGYDVPMPITADQEAAIQQILARHRAADRSRPHGGADHEKTATEV